MPPRRPNEAPLDRLRRARSHLNGTDTITPPHHPTAAAGGQALHTPANDPRGAAEIGLSRDEAAFFAEHGCAPPAPARCPQPLPDPTLPPTPRSFLVKRRLIPAEALRPFVELFWDTAPPCVDRSDASTWWDPGERWDSSDSQDTGNAKRADGQRITRGW